jgi:anti-sigma regulatory factor (Ser/Thr protein kinase)
MSGHASASLTDRNTTNGVRTSGPLVGARTVSFGVPGGVEAPRHARSLMSAHLRHIDRDIASDAELIISELVTNSVRHAGVGSDQLVTIDLILLSERLRITVTDPGCGVEPRLIPKTPEGLGGHGLRLVEQLSAEWGVGRDAVGATQVWCDLVLAPGRGRMH